MTGYETVPIGFVDVLTQDGIAPAYLEEIREIHNGHTSVHYVGLGLSGEERVNLVPTSIITVKNKRTQETFRVVYRTPDAPVPAGGSTSIEI